MAKIIYFITPKGLVKITTKAGEFIPVLGPALTYTKKAQKMTDLADPVSASSRGIRMMFEYCFGKAAKLSTECFLWFGFSVAGGVTANPALIAVGATFGEMVIDDLKQLMMSE